MDRIETVALLEEETASIAYIGRWDEVVRDVHSFRRSPVFVAPRSRSRCATPRLGDLVALCLVFGDRVALVASVFFSCLA